MNSDPVQSRSVEIAQRVLARDAPATNSDPTAVAAQLRQSCSRVLGHLQDALGDDGTTALIARALALTEARHPALKDLRRFNEDGIHLELDKPIQTHGAAAVTAALEALMAALLDVMGRLIGEDMAIRLIDPGYESARGNGRARAPRAP